MNILLYNMYENKMKEDFENENESMRKLLFKISKCNINKNLIRKFDLIKFILACAALLFSFHFTSASTLLY